MSYQPALAMANRAVPALSRDLCQSHFKEVPAQGRDSVGMGFNLSKSVSVARAIRRGALALGVVTGVMLGALLAGPGADGAETGGSESGAVISLTLRDGLVSLDARNAALGDILEAIAQLADLDLTITGELNETVTWSTSYVPADGQIRGWVLQKLLRRHSWVLTYTSGEESAPRPVAEIYILDSDGTAASGQPVQVTVRRDPRTDREEQILALKQLIQEPDESAVGDLASLATGDEAAEIRSMATLALGRLHLPEARAALVKAADDEDGMVRRVAVRGLGRMWGNGAIEQLSRAVLDDPAPVVRRQAVLELSIIGSDEAIGLLKMATNDPDDGVSRVAERNVEFLQGQREGVGSE